MFSGQETFWKQKAWVRWLKEGESNTRFFHTALLDKYARLTIRWIKDSHGYLLKEEAAIGQEAVEYFKDLLSVHQGSNAEVVMEELLAIIPPRVIQQQNAELTQEVMDLLQAVRDFFCDIPIPKGVANTSIVLLPKNEQPSTFTDFRPISLCTFFNKIFTKVLSTRMKPLMLELISPEQSAFVQGQEISDNILLTLEMLGSIDKKVRGHNMVLKVDIMKAFHVAMQIWL
nr:uncharacterized protein LOC113692127 [Coffea arabica]